MILKLKNTQPLFFTIDKKKRLPFINGGSIDIYSKEYIAIEAVQHYAEKKCELEIVMENTNSLVRVLADYFQFFGIKTLRIDMGAYCTELKLEEIVASKQNEKNTNSNSRLRLAMVEFIEETEWGIGHSENRERILLKEKVMTDEIKRSKLLIPVKFKNGEGIQLAMLKSKKQEDTKYHQGQRLKLLDHQVSRGDNNVSS